MKLNYRDLLAAAGLILITALTFRGVVSLGFINFDDDVHVTANAVVQRGLTAEGIRWALTTGTGASWHPLTWITHMADCQLFGLDAGAHHAVNLLLHLISVVLLYLFFRAATGDILRSIFVAGVFAVHPLHVESVAWVTERKDVLAGVFWMATMLAYGWYARKPSVRRMSVVLLCYVLGLLSKPMLVALPFVLLAVDYWPLARPGRRQSLVSPRPGGGSRTLQSVITWKQLLIEKIPMMALAGISSVVTLMTGDRGGALGFGNDFTAVRRIVNAIVGYALYAGKALWPVDLAIFYPYPSGGYGTASLIPATVLIAAMTLLAWKWRSRFPFLASGWGWYVAALLPVIGIVQIGYQSVADRYMYIPVIGLAVMAAWGIPSFMPERIRSFRNGAIAVSAVVLVCAGCSVHQLGYWKDNETLFGHTLDVTTGNWIANFNLGAALAERNEVDRAFPYLREAVRLKPEDAEVHIGLAKALTRLNRFNEAAGEFRDALRVAPQMPGLAYDCGYVYLRAGKLGEAGEYLSAAARQDTTDFRPRFLLGNIRLTEKRYGEAVAEYGKAVRINPNFRPGIQALERARALAHGASGE